MVQCDPGCAEAFEVGRAAWPDVMLAADEFAARIMLLGVTTEDLQRRASDLFLAVACAAGEPVALRHFESSFLSQVQGYVARFGLAADVVDDLRQRVRMKVLMGQPPGIARYGGRGPIGAWLRVTAVRLAIDAAKIAPEAASLTDLLELGSNDAGPEQATARRLYHERFRAALEESVKALSARDRTILRFHVVDGLHVDAIAAIYRVHRATVARWLVGIRGQVFENLRGLLNVGWKASPSELRSLIWMLRDQIHLTATRVLQQGP